MVDQKLREELKAQVAEWRTQDGDYPESKADCADEVCAILAAHSSESEPGLREEPLAKVQALIDELRQGDVRMYGRDWVASRLESILAAASETSTVGVLGPDHPAPWRTGRSVGRTLYDANDRLIGTLDTPELADRVVAAVNAQTERSTP